MTDLTDKIKKWLDDLPYSDEKCKKGALLLLKINKNKILYNNAICNPKKYVSRIAYELNKIYQSRTKSQAIKATRKEVEYMSRQADMIAKERALDNQTVQYKKGKRADHDQLPEEIKALYVENDQIRQKMKECHLRLRMINEQNSSCPDNDRYPWAKELLKLDRKYRDNWKVYDHYNLSTSKVELPSDPKAESKKALALINLNKGRYEVSQSESLKNNLKQWYLKVINPSDDLKSELIRLGILDEKGW